MKSKKLWSENSKQVDSYSQSFVEWYEEYQVLEELTAKIDWIEWELNRIRQQAEQRMSQIDHLFNPDID